ATGEACCLGAIPCSMGWIEGTHFVTGTPAGVDTMNVATDMESTTADHQNQYQITTNRSEVSSIALMADDGSGTFTQVCGSTSLTANTVTLDCTIPDGTVAIKPVCTITGETTPFEDASQHHTVYVDTIPPTYASDFSCNVSNAHEVDISCAWTIPGTAGTGEEIFGTIVRYTDTYDSTATCLADSFGLFDTGWSTLDDAPGLSTLDGAGIPGEAKNHTFTPFSPGPGYCMGEKLMDFGGNLSQGTGVSWTGAVYPTMQTIPGYSDDSQYGSALATVDLNCDGLKDLVVGAPIGHYDAACGGDGFCEGDGKVFAYFAKSTGGYSSTPDIVMTHDPDLGYDTYFNFGIAMAGIGNFSRHTAIGNDSPACEDLAVSALYMLNEDFYYTGEVYILKGRPDWTGFGQISTKTDDATSFDMVIKYRRGASDYSDNYYFYEEFGISLAAIGDFNGDGFGDMAIGAPGAMPSGAVYGLFSRPIPFKAGTNPPVYLEAPAQMSFSLLGNSTLSATVAPYVSDYEFLGWSMSALGDYNGDGYDDMLVGAPGCGGLWGYGTWGGTTNAPGKAFIILGGTGDSTTFDSVTYSGTRLFTLTQDTATIPGTSCFGWKVAGFGDINDDGLLDFGVSDRNYDMPGSSGVGNFEGALFVYFGDGTVGDLQTSDAGMKMRSENELTVSSDNFGVAVARSVETVNTPMGDFNNDGIPDILVGAQHFDTYHGSTFVWYGDVTLVPNYQPDNWITYEEATFWFTPPSPNGYWGVTTIWLGDSNNDGYSDIAIGDPVWDTFYSGGGSNPNRGRVTIIY
ncbi:integrin alpha, partial [Myxococcota bacterium]|nr:integrin alpha [Myxococcota bacterium]